jgi:hypothetical protein
VVLDQVNLLMSSTIAIVAHDAGGAELLSNFIKRNRLKGASFAIEGPAISVFCRVLGNIQVVTLEDAIDRANWVLTGSSWQSDLEWRALRLARTHGKPSVTFLDHWVNYKDRFVRMDTECLPDVLWVADRYAQQIAEREFPGMAIENKGNPYLESIAERAATRSIIIQPRHAHRVLIVTEPVSEHAVTSYGDTLHFGYTEFDAIALMFERLPKLLDGNELEQIVVRPHPSEPLQKYEYLVSNSQGLPVVVRKDVDLLDEVLGSSIVIGCETMALVVALAAGCRAVSCIPARGRACELPHDAIERWR